jgi:hypothetical protein
MQKVFLRLLEYKTDKKDGTGKNKNLSAAGPIRSSNIQSYLSQFSIVPLKSLVTLAKAYFA